MPSCMTFYVSIGSLVDASIISGTQLILYKMGTSQFSTTIVIVFNLAIT